MSDKLKDPYQLEQYINRIDHINEHRFSDANIIIGCGIADYLVSIRNNDSDGNDDLTDISTPFATHNLITVSDSLLNNLPELQSIERYDGELVIPKEMHMCSYTLPLSSDQKEEIKKRIIDDNYIMSDINYEYSINGIPLHGPIVKENTEGELFVATEENIKFTRIRDYRMYCIGEEEINIGDLDGTIDDVFGEEFEYEMEISDKEIMIDFLSNFVASIQEKEDELEIRLYHATDEELESFDRFLTELGGELEHQLNSEVSILMTDGSPKKALLSQDWVLDTNSIYRQKPGVNYNSISEFLLTNPTMHKRNIVIPWEVLCEINRHKDSNSSRTQNASEQGLENLEILRLLNKENILNLYIEDIPENIDNSIHENTGATDLSILNSVPDEGVLFTSDKHLMKISKLVGQETERIEDVSGFSDESRGNIYWNQLEDYLSDQGPIKKNEAIQVAEDELIDEEENIEKDPQQLIQEKINDRKIVEVTDGDEIYIALSDNREIIPTFPTINMLIRNVKEINGREYLADKALDGIRRALGGMPTTHRPNPTFIIPSEYVFRTTEIDQISSLESLQKLENCQLKTINIHSGESSESSIENSMIKASIEEDCPLICSPDEEVRKYNLLDLDFKTIDI